ncbi:hypothetical protein TSMEX_001241 [Taenia solium]
METIMFDTRHLSTLTKMEFGNKFPYADYVFGNSNEQSSDPNLHQREGTSEKGEPSNTDSILQGNAPNPQRGMRDASSSIGMPLQPQQEDSFHTPDKRKTHF